MEIGIVRYTYSEGRNLMSMKFDSFGTLKIACDMRHITGGDYFERIYDLSKKNIDSIHIDGAYVSFLNDKLGFVQLKFEYESCIVLDEFDMKGEHIDIVGCHDFNDEVGEEEI